MTDASSSRTREYVKYLGTSSLPQCEKNKRLLDLQSKVIEPNKGNFIPELSPDYNPRTGMLEFDNSRPVGLISSSNDSSSNNRIASKWIIKD
jgi:hypothetical protein